MSSTTVAGVISERGARNVQILSGELGEVSTGVTSLPRYECLSFDNVFVASRAGQFDDPPVVARRSDLVVAWIGQLHNANDLRRQFNLTTDESIAALAITVYRRWGVMGFGALLGDFCFALVDLVTRRLILVRDPIARYSLAYRIGKGAVAFSSDMRLLLALSNSGYEPSPLYIGEYCAGFPEASLSPFKCIQIVPPGCAVTIESGIAKIEDFWDLKRKRTIAYGRASEYESHFFHLFSEALLRRLNGTDCAVAELSGGLDSSSIVTVVDGLIREKQTRTSHLATVSLVCESARRSDESKFVEEVERWRNQAGTHIIFDHLRIGNDFNYQEWYDFPSAMRCLGELSESFANVMVNCKTRTLLSGFGGDQVLWGGNEFPYDASNAIARGDFRSAFRRVQQWANVLKTSVPRLLFRAMRSVNNIYGNAYSVPGWLDRDFVVHTDLINHLRRAEHRFEDSFELPSQRAQAGRIVDAITLISSGAVAYYSRGGVIRPSFPFLDRSLLEYLFSIPIEEAVAGGETRSLMRKTLSSILPPAVRDRHGKSTMHHAIYGCLRKNWRHTEELFRNKWCVESGAVDSRELKKGLERIKHGDSGALPDNILALISLELWLSAVEMARRSGPDLSCNVLREWSRVWGLSDCYS